MIAPGRHDQLGLVGHGDIEDLLALAGIGDQFRLGHDEAVAAGGGNDQLARRIVHEGRQHVLVVVHVDHDAQRFAMAATAGQLVGAEREDLAAGGEQDDLVGGLRRGRRVLRLSPSLNCSSRVRQVALERADPALLGDDDRDRFLLDHRLVDRVRVGLRRIGEIGAAARRARSPWRISSSPRRFPRRRSSTAFPRRRAAPRSRPSPSKACRTRCGSRIPRACASERRRMLRIASACTSVSLNVRDHHLLGLILLADDADDLVDIEIGDQIAAENFQPALDLGQADAASGAAARRGDEPAIRPARPSGS